MAGNWTNNGTFTARSGTVTFDGTSQTLDGTAAFNDFTKTEGADDSTDETLTFTAGTTQTIAGTWTLDGRDADDRINIVSSSPGTAWTVDPQGTRTLDFIDVTDSTNSNATLIDCTTSNCVSGGGNTGWHFTAVTATFSASTQTISETDSTGTVTVNLSASTEVDVTVPYTVTGTAIENTDYTITASPLTISAGDTSGTITVTPTNDSDVEVDETIIITMGTLTNASNGADTVQTITLTSDDAASSSSGGRIGSRIKKSLEIISEPITITIPPITPTLEFEGEPEIIPIPEDQDEDSLLVPETLEETTEDTPPPLTPTGPTILDKISLAITDTFTAVTNFLRESGKKIAQALKRDPTPEPSIPDPLPDPIPDPPPEHRYKEVRIRVATAEGVPLAGANFTLLPELKGAVTDNSGTATFTDVEIGEHTLKIAFGKFKGEQELFFEDEVPELLVNITLNITDGVHPLITIAVALASLVGGGSLVWFLAKRRFTGHFIV